MEQVPKITWRTNGDGSFTVRIEYGPDKVYVHTNKNRKVLQDLVAKRYAPRNWA